MIKLENYNNDGANWQAVAVLAYMRALDIFGGLGIYNEKFMEYEARIDVGRYENCREQGYVFSVRYFKTFGQVNYAVYEHRNSDKICVIRFEKNTINTPTLAEVTENVKDKWDVTKDFHCGEIMECGDWIRNDIRTYITKWKMEWEEKEKKKEELKKKEGK